MKAGTLLNFRESTTYSANNWGNLFSTVAYMLTWIVFLEAIFGKTQGVAGYSFNQIILLNLVFQTVFLILWFFSLANIDKFGEMVRKGDLDMVLSKPLPHLFYISVAKLDIPGMLINVTASITPLVMLLIKRGGVQVEGINLLAGVWIVAMGILAVHAFQFIFTCMALRSGQSRSLFRLTYEISTFGMEIPLEGFPGWMRVIGLAVIPCMLPSGAAVSVMLGKSPPAIWMIFATFLAVYFLYLKTVVWQKMISNYQSASS